MKRKEGRHAKKQRHISNRHLSDVYSYTGEHDSATNIVLTQYDESKIISRELDTTNTSFSKLIDKDYVNWFQISGLSDAEAITHIVKDCGLNNQDAKDILTPQHVVKVEEYKDGFFIILNSITYNENIEMYSEHVCFIVKENMIISFTESHKPLFENVFKALEANMLNLRKRGTGLLLAFLLNTVIANLVESASKVEEMLEDIEETLLDIKNNKENLGLSIQQRRREYMMIKRNGQPVKDEFSKLLHIDNDIIGNDIRPIFDDLLDQIRYVIQTSESCREIISSLVDLYISNNDLRMNAIMKRLTVVSTVFIPLTFLAGLWGMNFKFMPELDWPFGYPIAWTIMVTVGVATWLYMRSKDWY